MPATFSTADTTASVNLPHPPLPVLALGQVVATPAALELLERHGLSPMPFLARHAHGDWGCLCADDIQANKDALREDLRILSSYQVGHGNRAEILWLITDSGHLAPDGSVTTLLLPGDY